MARLFGASGMNLRVAHSSVFMLGLRLNVIFRNFIMSWMLFLFFFQPLGLLLPPLRQFLGLRLLFGFCLLLAEMINDA
jgi:hypothetical protein